MKCDENAMKSDESYISDNSDSDSDSDSESKSDSIKIVNGKYQCPECKKQDSEKLLCAPNISNGVNGSKSQNACNAPSGFS